MFQVLRWFWKYIIIYPYLVQILSVLVAVALFYYYIRGRFLAKCRSTPKQQTKNHNLCIKLIKNHTIFNCFYKYENQHDFNLEVFKIRSYPQSVISSDTKRLRTIHHEPMSKDKFQSYYSTLVLRGKLRLVISLPSDGPRVMRYFLPTCRHQFHLLSGLSTGCLLSP